jgi:TRAP-type C4-dicarboxylate transport system permease small subunit
MSVLEKCGAIISMMSRWLGYVSLILTWFLVAVILGEIFVRTVFHTSMGLSLQLSMWLFIGVVFLGSAYTLQQGGHVRVVIVSVRLPDKVRSWLSLVSSGIGLAIVLWLSWFGFHEALSCYEMNKIGSSSVYMPYWPVWIVFSIGIIMLGIQFAGLIIEEIIELSKGRMNR